MGSKFVFPGLFCWLLGALACTAPSSKEAPPKASADSAKQAVANDKALAEPAARDPHRDCCTQCANAAKRDQAGTALEPIDCRKYAGNWNGARGLDKLCGEHFTALHTTVGECWSSFPDLK